MKKIPLSELKEGMRVAKLDRQGVHFPYYGQALTRLEIVDELKKNGVEHVYVHLYGENEESGFYRFNAGSDIESLRPPCRSKIIETEGQTLRPGAFSPGTNLLFAQKIRSRAQNTVRNIFDNISNGQRPDFDSIKTVTDEFVSTCLYKNEVFMNMLLIREVIECEVNHAINVSILAIALGRRLGLPANELENLATAGLLHDIGMLTLPKTVYKDTGEISENEFRLLKTHPERSCDLLKKHGSINNSVLKAVHQHHERANGTGYPAGLYEKQISLNAKILAIADIYDSMTSDRPYAKGLTPVQAIKQIYGWAGKHFNETLVKFFVSLLGVYPVGTIVRLESGETGIVYEVARGSSDKPKILIITDKNGSEIEPLALDLSLKNEADGSFVKTVKETLTPNQITSDIFHILEKHLFPEKA